MCVTPVTLKSGKWTLSLGRRFRNRLARTRDQVQPIAGALAFLLLLWAFCGVSTGQTSGKTMSLGSDSIHAGDLCLMLGGTAESGDFFQGLRGRNTRKGRIFQKASARIRSYPEKLSVEIDAGFDACTGQGPQSCDR